MRLLIIDMTWKWTRLFLLSPRFGLSIFVGTLLIMVLNWVKSKVLNPFASHQIHAIMLTTKLLFPGAAAAAAAHAINMCGVLFSERWLRTFCLALFLFIKIGILVENGWRACIYR